jgi:hypothetical protein
MTRGALGDTGAVLLMIGLMLPFFFTAMYEKDGQPAEKVVRNIIRTRFYWPGKRPYKTENLYEYIEKEAVQNSVPKKITAQRSRSAASHNSCKNKSNNK